MNIKVAAFAVSEKSSNTSNTYYKTNDKCVMILSPTIAL